MYIKNGKTKPIGGIYEKECAICKKEFEAANQFQSICSDECKEEALSRLDRETDECLSCQ